jgi:hypothetical protein
MDAPHYVYVDVSSGDSDQRRDRHHWNKNAPHHLGADLHSEYSAIKKKDSDNIMTGHKR